VKLNLVSLFKTFGISFWSNGGAAVSKGFTHAELADQVRYDERFEGSPQDDRRFWHEYAEAIEQNQQLAAVELIDKKVQQDEQLNNFNHDVREYLAGRLEWSKIRFTKLEWGKR
jgi:hypothetical protein